MPALQCADLATGHKEQHASRFHALLLQVGEMLVADPALAIIHALSSERNKRVHCCSGEPARGSSGLSSCISMRYGVEGARMLRTVFNTCSGHWLGARVAQALSKMQGRGETGGKRSHGSLCPADTVLLLMNIAAPPLSACGSARRVFQKEANWRRRGKQVTIDEGVCVGRKRGVSLQSEQCPCT